MPLDHAPGGPAGVRFNRDQVEAFVKMELLLDRCGELSAESDPGVIAWLCLWLGPHWLVQPHEEGMEITRAGYEAFRGQLRDFPYSPMARQHDLIRSSMLGEDIRVVRELATGLERVILDLEGLSDPWNLQRQVQAYFRQALKQ